MNRSDYLLVIATGFLTAPDNKLNSLCDYFSKYFVVDEPFKIGSVSLAGTDWQSNQVSFKNWLDVLRKKSVLEIKVGSYIAQDKLPDHLAAAFMNSVQTLLDIKTLEGREVYALSTVLSPRLKIKPSEFRELIDAQKNPEAFWATVWEKVDESNKLNSLPSVELVKIRNYFESLEGQQQWEWSAETVFREMQIDALVSNNSFEIPNKFEKFVKAVTPNPMFPEPTEERTFYYLYALDNVTAEHLIQIVDAQEYTDLVWEQCSTKEQLDVGLEWSFPKMKATEWPPFLKSLTPERLKNLSSIVTRSICEVGERIKSKPIIPNSLKTLFGPDEAEEKRIYYRGKLQKDTGWYLDFNDEGWEQNLLRFVSNQDLKLVKLNSAEIKIRFNSILEKAMAFAARLDSPFAEAFKLSHFFLNFKGNTAISLKDIKEAGFTETALTVAERDLGLLNDWQQFSWPSEKLNGLLAVSISNVFGGMGSWNDQYFEGDDQKQYLDISSELFKEMNNYFLSLATINSRAH